MLPFLGVNMLTIDYYPAEPDGTRRVRVRNPITGEMATGVLGDVIVLDPEDGLQLLSEGQVTTKYPPEAA